ncbi:hypothetical protein NE237_022803 [Protea cynaroides]|uniref:Uncharacterized protein n=1 Tax=Protea cynaroides TaxID=273540 RepID=A0A9Q0HBN9_9MAGN|nr:hypothetical protein NE237_022803 [Protea cynaroides]
MCLVFVRDNAEAVVGRTNAPGACPLCQGVIQAEDVMKQKKFCFFPYGAKTKTKRYRGALPSSTLGKPYSAPDRQEVKISNMCFVFVCDQEEKVSDRKAAPGACPDCEGVVQSQDVETIWKFCYVPYRSKTNKRYFCTQCPKHFVLEDKKEVK